MPPPEKNTWRKYVPGGPGPMPPNARRRILTFAAIFFVLGIILIPSLFSSKTVKSVNYSNLLTYAKEQKVVSASINNTSGV